jgi:hypothetical protein
MLESELACILLYEAVEEEDSNCYAMVIAKRRPDGPYARIGITGNIEKECFPEGSFQNFDIY